MADCQACGAELLPGALACTQCHALVHAERLKALAHQAQSATSPTEALQHWRAALELLPPYSRQAEVIRARIAEGVEAVDEGDGPDGWMGRLAGAGGFIGAAALLAWKLKGVLLLLLTKGKLLLVGLTKGKMLFSMVLSLGVYWAAFGWWFAFGLIVMIYVHEMGHVWALQRYGIRASAPMFLPGLGAVVRLDQYPQSAHEDATIGLAGPLWGIAAALVTWGLGVAIASPLLIAIAKIGGWLNLFNLLPVWQLDGARGIRVLDRPQRWALLGVDLLAWTWTGDGLLLLLGMLIVWRILADGRRESGDWRGFARFALVLLVGSGMTLIQVPGLADGTLGP